MKLTCAGDDFLFIFPFQQWYDGAKFCSKSIRKESEHSPKMTALTLFAYNSGIVRRIVHDYDRQEVTLLCVHPRLAVVGNLVSVRLAIGNEPPAERKESQISVAGNVT